MKASEQTIGGLFSGDAVFVTPSFQRPYSFRSDYILSLVEASLSSNDETILLGAAVLRPLKNIRRGEKRLLVDGNQRMISLLLLLVALRDSSKGFEDEIDSLLHAGMGKEQPRSIVSAHDRASFENLLRGAAPSSTGEMRKAYSLALDSYKAAKKDKAGILRKLKEGFSFVIFDLAPEDDPAPLYRLFNTEPENSLKKAFDAYARFNSDPELMDLLAGGESQEVEFKSRTIGHGREDGAHFIMKAVAGMLNSATGGILLIGIEDSGAICGIEDEYPAVDRGKSNWDGYMLFLANSLRSSLESGNAFLHYSIERKRADSHDICLVRIKPSDRPVYLAKRLYVRTQNQTVEMLGPDLVDYVSKRFGGIA